MLRQNVEAALSTTLISPPLRDVEMEVVFGTPSKNCSGTGICMIASLFPHGYTIPCPHAPAIIHCIPNEELVFRFRKHRLCDRAVQAYFSSCFFQVDEPFTLPQRLVRLWALPISEIPPGRYFLEEYSGEWRLYFPIQPAKLP